MYTFVRAFALLCVVVLLVATVNPANAEEVETGDIVVTSIKGSEPLAEVTQDVIIITSEDIEKSGATYLPELLRRTTDINVVQNGGYGAQTSYFLRGGASNQIVVLIDGIKVKSATTGSLDISKINIKDVERIEILKGAQSTLYGGEAMAGVINIITKKGQSGAPVIGLDLEAGSHSTYDGTVYISGGVGVATYRLTASIFETEGVSAFKDGDEADGYSSYDYSAKLGLAPHEKVAVELSFKNTTYDGDVDDYDFMGNFQDNLFYTYEGQQQTGSLRAELFLHKNYEQILTIGSTKEQNEYIDPNVGWNNYEIATNMQSFEWQHNINFKPAKITLGYERRIESGESVGNFDELIANNAYYANIKSSYNDGTLVFNLGARSDDHEVAGQATTYRIGALYNIKSADMIVRANHSTGFRAPTINELFYENAGWMIFTNPDLKPEYSTGFDIGITKSLLNEKATVSLDYFKTEYTDLISYYFDPDTFISIPINIGEANISGIELSIDYKINDNIALWLNHTYMETENGATGDELVWRPKNKTSLGLDYVRENINAGIDLLSVSERKDVGTNPELEAYNLVNANVSYQITKRITIGVRGENIFDEDYEEAGGYGVLGATYHAQVSLRY